MYLRTKDIVEKYKISAVMLRAWDKQGLLNTITTVGNHRRYLETDIKKLLHIDESKITNDSTVAIYARCSTRKQLENLNRQIERLNEYAINNNYQNTIVYQEIASGLNDNRKQFHKMIDDVIHHKIDLILVEYQDRLTRFNFKIIEHLLNGYGCKIEIINNKRAYCAFI